MMTVLYSSNLRKDLSGFVGGGDNDDSLVFFEFARHPYLLRLSGTMRNSSRVKVMRHHSVSLLFIQTFTKSRAERNMVERHVTINLDIT